MRLPLIAPTDLTPEQKFLYDDMHKGIANNVNAFKVEREDGALVGPWNRWLHEPAIGKANLVGLYDLISTTLNGFNVPVPERE